MSHTKRLRFNSDDDLCLLREVVGQNPLQHPEKWNIVQANIRSVTGKEFLTRTLKDHLMLLLTLFMKKTNGDKFKSGTEEVFTEKDVLLQEIRDLCDEFQLMPATKKKKVLTKEKQIAALGRQNRENDAINAMKENNNNCNEPEENIIITLEEHDYFDPNSSHLSLAEVNCGEEIQVPSLNTASSAETSVSQATQNTHTKKTKEPGPVKKTRLNKSVILRKNAMEYLTKKNEKDQELRLKELQLQEEKYKLEARKIQIEEMRLEMEIEDRKKQKEIEYEKLKLDFKQKSELHTHIASQQKLIDTLLKRLQRYED